MYPTKCNNSLLIITDPNVVSNPKAIGVSTSAIRLEWTPPSEADHFKVDQLFSNGSLTHVNTTTQSSLTVSSGLVAGTAYTFQIRTVVGDVGETNPDLIKESEPVEVTGYTGKN